MNRYILQRICYNTKSWRWPDSERVGKLESKYMRRDGFGHEEWQFNTTHTIKGEVYGYMYSRPGQKALEKLNGKFYIYFFTINPSTMKRDLVGYYKNACFLNDSEIKELKKKFVKSGIIDQKAEDLLNIKIDNKIRFYNIADAKKKLLEDFCFNIKVKASNIEVFEPPIVLTKKLCGRDPCAIRRFTRFADLNKPIKTTRHANLKTAPEDKPLDDLPEDSYTRIVGQKRKTIKRYQNKLSNKFKDWLNKIGAKIISRESNNVDYKFKYLENTYLCELKTCYDSKTRHAIRESVGQILEYNYYPGRVPCDKMIIVLDQSPTETDLEYIKKLQSIRINILLLWLHNSSVYTSEYLINKQFNEFSATGILKVK